MKNLLHLIIVVLFVSIPYISKAEKDDDLQKMIEVAKELCFEDPDSAITILYDAERIALNKEDKKSLAEIYRRIGLCFYFTNELSTSYFYHEKALDLRTSGIFDARDSTHLTETANINYNLSIIAQSLGKQREAIQFAMNLEKLYLELNDYEKLAFRCYNMIAKIYYNLGDNKIAMEYSYKALRIYEKIKDFIGVAESKDFQAMIKINLHELDEALELSLEALKIRESINDSLMISFSYNNIGNNYLLRENYDTAIIYFNMSIEIKKRLNDINNLASPYSNLALAYERLGKFEESIKYNLMAYEFIKQSTDIFSLTGLMVNIGVVYSKMGRNVESEKYLKDAYDISVDYGFKARVIQVAESLGELYAKIGKYKDAYEIALIQSLYVDSVVNDETTKQLARMDVEYEFRQKQIADSIMHHQEEIRKDAVYKEELKRKEQTIFISIVVFLFIIFVIIILFKAYQLRKTNQENILKQKALEIEKNLLRSQMNPHFIFNAMNSIQSFIAVNDTYSAERYLSKFARLIRLILENSTQHTIPLSDELQSLNLYLDLERVRFNNKFSFYINLSPEIEEELICVPPMLIQPFIENAILHGLMHKEGEGLITININDDEENQKLICEIIDDGIGREAAAELKERFRVEGRKHKSVGMQLTRERLASLNKETEKEMSCEILDLFDVNNNPIGTKVIVMIPYHELQNFEI